MLLVNKELHKTFTDKLLYLFVVYPDGEWLRSVVQSPRRPTTATHLRQRGDGEHRRQSQQSPQPTRPHLDTIDPSESLIQKRQNSDDDDDDDGGGGGASVQ